MFWYDLFCSRFPWQDFKEKIEASLQNRPQGMLSFQKCQSNSFHAIKECPAENTYNDDSMLLSY